MNPLDLFKEFCPDKIPSLGPSIGKGTGGEVFLLSNHLNKVIKFSINYLLLSHYSKNAISYLINNPHPAFALIDSYQSFGPYIKNNKTFTLSVIVLEKLNKISEDEEKVFHSILSHEDRNIQKNFDQEKVRKMIAGLSRGLDFDAQRIILLCDNLRKSSVRHPDIHPRNIMKDDLGNFKLVDFDHLILNNCGELNDTENI